MLAVLAAAVAAAATSGWGPQWTRDGYPQRLNYTTKCDLIASPAANATIGSTQWYKACAKNTLPWTSKGFDGDKKCLVVQYVRGAAPASKPYAPSAWFIRHSKFNKFAGELNFSSFGYTNVATTEAPEYFYPIGATATGVGQNVLLARAPGTVEFSCKSSQCKFEHIERVSQILNALAKESAITIAPLAETCGGGDVKDRLFFVDPIARTERRGTDPVFLTLTLIFAVIPLFVHRPSWLTFSKTVPISVTSLGKQNRPAAFAGTAAFEAPGAQSPEKPPATVTKLQSGKFTVTMWALQSIVAAVGYITFFVFWNRDDKEPITRFNAFAASSALRPEKRFLIILLSLVVFVTVFFGAVVITKNKRKTAQLLADYNFRVFSLALINISVAILFISPCLYASAYGARAGVEQGAIFALEDLLSTKYETSEEVVTELEGETFTFQAWSTTIATVILVSLFSCIAAIRSVDELKKESKTIVGTPVFVFCAFVIAAFAVGTQTLSETSFEFDGTVLCSPIVARKTRLAMRWTSLVLYFVAAVLIAGALGAKRAYEQLRQGDVGKVLSQDTVLTKGYLNGALSVGLVAMILQAITLYAHLESICPASTFSPEFSMFFSATALALVVTSYNSLSAI